jgi:hypothetical protein
MRLVTASWIREGAGSMIVLYKKRLVIVYRLIICSGVE